VAENRRQNLGSRAENQQVKTEPNFLKQSLTDNGICIINQEDLKSQACLELTGTLHFFVLSISTDEDDENIEHPRSFPI
jgi:hypothetical protein